MLLTTEQINDGAAQVAGHDNKLTVSMVFDLLSIFRGYLGPLADGYDIEGTLTAEQDTPTSAQRCAKLAACLTLFQENQFTPASGFAPTVANRTGFNYSMDGEVYEIFKYAWGLFWDLPKEMELRFQSANAGSRSSEGQFIRR